MVCLDICETLLQSARSRSLIGAERRNFTKFYRQWVFADDPATFRQPYGHPSQKNQTIEIKIILIFYEQSCVSNFVQRLTSDYEIPRTN